MKPFRLGLLSAAIFLATSVVAMAQAVTSADVSAYNGPSVDSGYVTTVPVNTPVTVERCENSFCMVYYGRSPVWIGQQYIVEMAPPPRPPQPQPQPQPQPPLPQPPVNPGWPWPQPHPQPPRPPLPPVIDDEAGACFYTERNFRGSSLCVEEGDSYSRLRNWDNKIRSVEVFGGARVDLCTDSNYRGSCVTLRRDASRLPPEIDRKTSSIDVY